jgi:hypothetical protein
MTIEDKLRLIGLGQKFDISENGRVIKSQKSDLVMEIDDNGNVDLYTESQQGYEYVKCSFTFKEINDMKEFYEILTGFKI